MKQPAAILEVLVMRAAPGLLNLAALLTIAHRTKIETYGLFSTLLATGNFLSSIVFGVLIFPVVAQFARHEATGLGAYSGVSLTLFGLIAAPFLVFGAAGSAVFGYAGALAPLVVIMSLHLLLQEFARAALMIRFYVFSDAVQAVLFLASAFFLARPGASAGELAWLAVWPYIAAVLLNLFALRRRLRPRFDRVVARDILSGGGWLVAVNLSENLLILGARYVLLGFGSREQLGIFSFCMDLAQRSVGFVINVATFVFVPRAFAADRAQESGAFRREILRGAAFASVLGLASTAVLAVAINVPNPIIHAEKFDAVVFVLVAAAVVITRMRKLVVDPFAMRSRRTHTLAAANVAGGLAGLAVIWLLLRLGAPDAAASGYLAGWALIFLAAVTPFAREILGLTPPAPTLQPAAERRS